MTLVLFVVILMAALAEICFGKSGVTFLLIHYDDSSVRNVFSFCERRRSNYLHCFLVGQNKSST